MFTVEMTASKVAAAAVNCSIEKAFFWALIIYKSKCAAIFRFEKHAMIYDCNTTCLIFVCFIFMNRKKMYMDLLCVRTTTLAFIKMKTLKKRSFKTVLSMMLLMMKHS